MGAKQGKKAKVQAKQRVARRKAATVNLKVQVQMTPHEPQSFHRVLVAAVLDKSGSMAARQMQVISGYNEYLDGLRADKKTAYRISLRMFDNYSRYVHEAVPLADVPRLNQYTYQPSGGTALVDAVADAIVNDVDKGSPTEKIIVLVFTDGEENASLRYTSDTLRAMIVEREARGNWTFVYLGADQNAWHLSRLYGFTPQNTIRYDGLYTHQAYQGTRRGNGELRRGTWHVHQCLRTGLHGTY